MVLCDAGGDVVMWAREPEVEESINTTHTNEMFHPGIALPEQMRATGDRGRGARRRLPGDPGDPGPDAGDEPARPGAS